LHPSRARSRELQRKPLFAIERYQGCLNVRYDGLDLDDEKNPRDGVECQNIDRSALAPHVERHLGRDEPAGSGEQAHDLLDQRRVVGIEEAIETLAVPREPADHPGAKRPRDLFERLDGHAVGMALLDPRDRAARDPGFVGQIVLAEVPP